MADEGAVKAPGRRDSTEPVHVAALRRVCFPVFRRLYRLLGLQGRAFLSRLPGATAIFCLLKRRFLLVERTEEGWVSATVHGMKVCLDPNEVLSGFFLGEYEPATTFVFKALLDDGDIAVDVGANWGYFTLLAASLCGARGKVLAFEPHPGNYALLARNIQANRLTNVLAVQKAVSSKTGTAQLLLARSTIRHSLCFVPPELRFPLEGDDHMMVDTVTLDDFFAENPFRPKLIKLDIEGGEPLALAGMTHLIERDRDLVLIAELLPDNLGAGTTEDFLNRLLHQGFRLAVIDDELYQIVVGASIRQVVEWCRDKPGSNLLWTRGPMSVERLLERRDLGNAKRGAPRIVRI